MLTLIFVGLGGITQNSEAQSIERADETGECAEGGLAEKHCPYWDITVKFDFYGASISCTTGGNFICSKKKDGTKKIK